MPPLRSLVDWLLDGVPPPPCAFARVVVSLSASRCSGTMGMLVVCMVASILEVCMLAVT